LNRFKGYKTYRVKKDTILYHPSPILLLKGSTFKAISMNGIILVDPKRCIITSIDEMKEYIEEIETKS